MSLSVLVGCGGGGATYSAGTAPQDVDPCALLAADEATDQLGGSFDSGDAGTDYKGDPSCTFTDEDGGGTALVTVFSDSFASSDEWRRAQVGGDPKPDNGPWDAGLFTCYNAGDGCAEHFLVGKVGVTVRVEPGPSGREDDAFREDVQALARKVAGRFDS